MQTKLLLALAATSLCGNLAAQTLPPAFPGAEGHGRYTQGGRGGRVVHVTNLNDRGPGSLREAVKGSTKKIVVFDVGGVIPLASDLTIGANTTLLGQTAPYPGITLRYFTVHPSANNVIRFIRVRRGQEKNVNDGADAIWAKEMSGLILDHCSFSWSIDEIGSFYDNNNFTLQWCTLGESLVNSGHDKGAHGYGGIWGGKLASFHHNMIAHVDNRAPRFNGARYNWQGYTQNADYAKYKWANTVQAENVDLRNCLIFDWGGGGCYGGPGGGYVNMVNNYYRPTAETRHKTQVTQASIANSTTLGDDKTYADMTSRYYISGNYVHGYGANYDWRGVTYDKGVQYIGGEAYTPDPSYYYGQDVEHKTSTTGVPSVRIKLDSPVAPAGEVTTHTAEQAYAKVMAYAGASLFRDDVDARYMSEARSGVSTYAGSVTHTKGLIDVVADADGYTERNFPTGKREAGYDTDGDGMPDAWEKANGLNPADPADGQTKTLDGRGLYTNLEVYASTLVEDIMRQGNADAETAVEEYYPAARRAEGIDYYSAREVQRISVPEETTNPTEPATPVAGTAGALIWKMDDAQLGAATVATDIAAGVASSAVTLGTDMQLAGTRGINGLTMTLVQPTVGTTAATEANGLTFAFTLAEGYSFRPTRVGLTASRIGTDGGQMDIVYTAGAHAQQLATAEKPNRNNEAGGYYSQYSLPLTDVPTTAGTHTLTISIYNLGTTKQCAFAGIVIEGTMTSAAGISHTVRIGTPAASAYDLGGRRVSASYRGIVVREGKKYIQR